VGILASLGGASGILSTVGGFLKKLLTGKLGADKDIALAQAEITKAEIANAPKSRLFLWRSFLGTVLVWLFVILIVLMVASVFFPELKHEAVGEAFRYVSQMLFMLLGFGS
jgi:hypothetical protein